MEEKERIKIQFEFGKKINELCEEYGKTNK